MMSITDINTGGKHDVYYRYKHMYSINTHDVYYRYKHDVYDINT